MVDAAVRMLRDGPAAGMSRHAAPLVLLRDSSHVFGGRHVYEQMVHDLCIAVRAQRAKASRVIMLVLDALPMSVIWNGASSGAVNSCVSIIDCWSDPLGWYRERYGDNRIPSCMTWAPAGLTVQPAPVSKSGPGWQPLLNTILSQASELNGPDTSATCPSCTVTIDSFDTLSRRYGKAAAVSLLDALRLDFRVASVFVMRHVGAALSPGLSVQEERHASDDGAYLEHMASAVVDVLPSPLPQGSLSTTSALPSNRPVLFASPSSLPGSHPVREHGRVKVLLRKRKGLLQTQTMGFLISLGQAKNRPGIAAGDANDWSPSVLFSPMADVSKACETVAETVAAAVAEASIKHAATSALPRRPDSATTTAPTPTPSSVSSAATGSSSAAPGVGGVALPLRGAPGLALPFRMELSSQEKEQKRSVVLPYEHQGMRQGHMPDVRVTAPFSLAYATTEGGLAHGRTGGGASIPMPPHADFTGKGAGVQVGGHILYERDSDDDVPDSDEDPDDDLDI